MGDTQMKEKPSPLGHLQSRPQFYLNQLGGSSHLPSSQGTTPTSRTHVKKNLRATAAVSEDDEGTNQETGQQGVGENPGLGGWRAGPGCHQLAG